MRLRPKRLSLRVVSEVLMVGVVHWLIINEFKMSCSRTHKIQGVQRPPSYTNKGYSSILHKTDESGFEAGGSGKRFLLLGYDLLLLLLALYLLQVLFRIVRHLCYLLRFFVLGPLLLVYLEPVNPGDVTCVARLGR